MKKAEESDFCYYPFIQILVTSEGKYRPCSKHLDHISHRGRVLKASEASIEEAWNSDYMKEMRRQFNANEKFPGCGECWRLQKMGLKSMRYDSYQYDVSDKQVENPIAPLRVELNSSNHCNLKCRICYPTASSQWIKEAKELYGWDESIHKNLGNGNLSQVMAWAKNLQEICFFGGEPLLSKENIQLMHYLVKEGYAKDIQLLFNTNGTVFNDEIASLICAFKKVRMYFSIDDIEERFEYQRKGAKWDRVVKNIRKAYDLSRSEKGKNVIFKICNTVSIFNIYYYPEFFEYFNKAFPGLPVFWNLIFDPWEFNIQILPKPIKDIISYRLNNLVATTYDLNEEDTKTIENLVQYLNYAVEQPIEGFFRLVNTHDVYRKESFSEIFPELWELLKKYKPESLDMGQYSSFERKQQDMIQNPSNYPYYNDVVKLRNEWIFMKERDSLNAESLINTLFNALVEIEQVINNGKQVSNQLNQLRLSLQNEECNFFDFMEDFLVFGPFKFYKAIMEMDAKQLSKLLQQKYPVVVAST